MGKSKIIALVVVVVLMMALVACAQRDYQIMSVSGTGFAIEGANTDQLVVDQTGTGDIVEFRNNGTVRWRLAYDGAITSSGAQTFTGDVGVTGDVTASGTITATTGLVGEGNVSLGDAIGDNIYVYGQMRSYDGSDNWADISDVSALDRGNGWHTAYKVTGWGGATQFQALFANAQISDTMESGTSAYGVEAKMTASNGQDHLGTGYGLYGKLTAKDANTKLAAGYPIYSIIDVNNSAVVTSCANYYAELSGEATIGTVAVLQTKAADTWDYGVDFNGSTMSTAEFRGSNGEIIANTTDTAWRIGGFMALEEASTLDLASDGTITATASYQPVTTSETSTCTLNATTSIADGPVAGAILIICNEDASYDVVIKDGANTALGGDITLTGGAEDCLTLLWNGSDWVALSVHDN